MEDLEVNLLEIAVNDLRFNYRMWRRDKRSFIKEDSLNLDFEKLESALAYNDIAYNNNEEIIVVEKGDDDRFKAKMISPSDSNYADTYKLQRDKFNSWMKACKIIQDYITKYDKMSTQVETLMGEVYQNVNKPAVEEEVKALEAVSGGFDVDNIINSLTEKAVELEKHTRRDKSHVDNIINSLTEKAVELEEHTRRDRSHVKELIRSIRNYHEIMDRVNDYYFKLEKLLNNKKEILDFYKENSEYIEDTLNLDIDCLKEKLREYEKLYEEKKPFMIVGDDDQVEFLYFGQDDSYVGSFRYTIDNIVLTIKRAEIIKNRDYVRDHAMEMIFDEIADVSEKIEGAIKDGDDFEFSDVLVWIEASDKVLKSLKDQLENDYKNGNLIKVARFENGEYVVTEEENSLENYETQLEFLNNAINRCKEISDTLNEKLDEKNNTKLATGISNDVKGRSDIVEQLIEFKNNNDIDGIKKMFKEGNPGTIWSMLASEISHGLVDASEGDNLVNFITSNYDSDELREDDVVFNSGYRNLLEILRPKRVQPLETDVTKIQKPLDVKKGKKVVRREKKKSLIEKFKGLKRWQKTAIVAGLTLAGVAIIGVGVYHLIPEVKPMIDGFIQNLHIPNFGQPISDVATQTPALPSEPLVQAPQVSQAASVDYSSFGEGHRVFADAYSAASGVNPMEASGWFNGNPLDVFNVDTNEFMNLTREQLHDAEFLKTLASNPNNTMLFGADMSNPDGFVPLSEIVGEAIKGGKIL